MPEPGARRSPFARPEVLALAAALLVALAPAASSQEESQGSAVAPSRVKAAFLRNFARYVSWPTEAFAGARSPWCIGVVGDDPFGDVLEQTLRGRLEQDRPFEIHRARTVEALLPCHIVVVAVIQPERRRAILDALRGTPVLTVGDAPDFLREGGIIRFDVGDRVQLSVNLDAARAASLRIQTKVLEISHEVVENGVVRKVR